MEDLLKGVHIILNITLLLIGNKFWPGVIVNKIHRAPGSVKGRMGTGPGITGGIVISLINIAAGDLVSVVIRCLKPGDIHTVFIPFNLLCQNIYSFIAIVDIYFAVPGTGRIMTHTSENISGQGISEKGLVVVISQQDPIVFFGQSEQGYIQVLPGIIAGFKTIWLLREHGRVSSPDLNPRITMVYIARITGIIELTLTMIDDFYLSPDLGFIRDGESPVGFHYNDGNIRSLLGHCGCSQGIQHKDQKIYSHSK
jgi:hypothetical protein